jgi:hypothetical protein
MGKWVCRKKRSEPRAPPPNRCPDAAGARSKAGSGKGSKQSFRSRRDKARQAGASTSCAAEHGGTPSVGVGSRSRSTAMAMAKKMNKVRTRLYRRWDAAPATTLF